MHMKLAGGLLWYGSSVLIRNDRTKKHFDPGSVNKKIRYRQIKKNKLNKYVVKKSQQVFHTALVMNFIIKNLILICTQNKSMHRVTITLQ